MKKLVILFIYFCFLSINAHSSSTENKVTVFAAASLTNALDEIAHLYQQQIDQQQINQGQINQGQSYQGQRQTKVTTSFASSSVLARQIEYGAPADIFISADQKWMNYLSDKQLIEKTSRKDLLSNSLVVIVPINSPIKSVVINKETDWLTLLADSRLAVGDPDHVPAGVYAKEALQFLESWSLLETKLARADNVRGALMLVERGESPLGIVYGSDAKISTKVHIVGEFPQGSHELVTYPVSIIKNQNRVEVELFYQFLQGTSAKDIFAKHGFTVL